MRTGAATWAIGFGISALAHLGAGAALMAALQPRPIADQPRTQSRLQVTPEVVERSAAAAQTPDSTQTTTGQVTGAVLGAGPVPLSSAAAQAVSQTSVAPQPAVAQPTAPIRVKAAAVPTQSAKAAISPTVTPNVQSQRAQIPSVLTATLIPPTNATSAATTPPAPLATSRTPKGTGMQGSALNATPTKAILAFPNVGDGAVDPASLAAFQSFTQPDPSRTDDLRDTLQALLSLPCARMQVSFDPDTTTLQLTGHVPREDQRAPVLAALVEQMGGDIAVTDNLLVLPEPQCGALSGIAQIGLPQSTDQITNPLIVGRDTHARSFRYLKDDPLVLDLIAPDYPAFVYVDYFDADGNVIHLSPNAQTPLRAANAQEQLSIGARSIDDPGLRVIIGPPYGQEIAVAFAASAPLHEGLRPLVEPAKPYLEWMQSQVAAAKLRDRDFKGEWVYFFVQTSAK